MKMKHQAMVVCIIGFALLTILRRCLMVSGFVYRLPQRSGLTCAASVSDDSEVLVREIFKDKPSWLMARALFKMKYEQEKNYKALYEKVIEAKDEAIEAKDKAIEAQDKALAEKERMIVNLDAQLLASKSRLTVRGVFEYFVDYLRAEIVKANFAKISELRTVTKSLMKAAEMAYFQNWSATEYPNVLLLRGSYEKCISNSMLWTGQNCSDFLVDIYGELSKDIHGAPWAGPKVLNTLKAVGDGGYSCFMVELCSKKFCLELVDNTTRQESTDSSTLPENVREVGYNSS